MRVSRRRGRLRVRLDAVESETLDRLLDELGVLLREGEAADPVVVRLFPSAYPDDPDAEADYRDITETGLRQDRLERIAACSGDLHAGGAHTGGAHTGGPHTGGPHAGGPHAEIDLGDPEVAQRWLRVLNDLRLAIGTRIGVQEDEADLDPRDPDLNERVLYHWLTHLQDSVVVGLME